VIRRCVGCASKKNLRQSDFSGLTAKEIARIERGVVKKPTPTSGDVQLRARDIGFGHGCSELPQKIFKPAT
jgi:hypothetical protein